MKNFLKYAHANDDSVACGTDFILLPQIENKQFLQNVAKVL